MKSLWILPAAALFVFAAERPARADVMTDPCMMIGKMAGDPCITPANMPGTCVPGMMGLICQPTASSSSSSGAGSGSSGSGSGSGSGGAGGSGSGPGANGGCSCRTGDGTGDGWGGLSLLLAIPLLARWRRRR